MITEKQLRDTVNAYKEKMILPSAPLRPMWNRENFVCKKQPKWNYIDACMIKAVMMLNVVCADSRLTEYAECFTNAYVAEDGTIPTMRAEDFNLDNINGGKNLLQLYRITGNERYRLAFENLITGQLAAQPRLMCGSFFHKAIYENQMWLDGAYMALPFMTEYSLISDNKEMLEDVCIQLENIRNLMRDGNTGLYYHAYDESRRQKWADKKTGLSPNFWLRAMGWLCAGLADICELAPKDSRLYGISAEMLADVLDALAMKTTDDGMLLQLPALSISGNYPETSGTLLFAYSALKAARLGISGSRIRNTGEKAFSCTAEKFITLGENVPVLRNICLTAGLGGNPYRDGSAEYYLSERIIENDAKGIAPFIMTYTEFLRMQ